MPSYPRGAHRLSGGRNYRRVVATLQNDATGAGAGSSGTHAPPAIVQSISSGSGNQGTASSCIMTFGAAPTTGNLMIAGVVSSHTPATPTGWTAIDSVISAGDRHSTFYRVAQAGDSATVTFTTAASDYNSGTMFEITNHNGIDQHSGTTMGAGGNDNVSPSLTPSVIGCLALAFFSSDSQNGSYSITAGWNIDQTGNSTSGFFLTESGTHKTALTADTSTAITATFHSTVSQTKMTSHLILVKPA